MPPTNKYDLQTVQKTLTGADGGTDLGIAIVPMGKKRFVCFIKIYCPTGNVVSMGQAVSATGTLEEIKDKQGLVADDTIAYPDKIDAENPFFSIEKGKYLGVITSIGVTDTEITIVYYDE
jgi:hypothetical protein